MERRPWNVVVMFLLLGSIGCREESIVEGMVPPTDSSAILINTSFELGGNPTLAGWAASNPNVVDFSSDVPPDGDSWSVTIGVEWAPPTFPPAISSNVRASEGTHIYQLRLWAKRAGLGGSAAIMLKRPDTLLVSRFLSIPDTGWTAYNIIDTISAEPGDSVGVRLAGATSQLATGTTFFDLCVLEKLE